MKNRILLVFIIWLSANLAACNPFALFRNTNENVVPTPETLPDLAGGIPKEQMKRIFIEVSKELTPQYDLSEISGAECISPYSYTEGMLVSITSPERIFVKIIKVIMEDGTTFIVEDDVFKPVLLFGVKALKDSSEYLDELVGSTVYLFQDVTEETLEGELPRYVIVNDQFVNYHVISEGSAMSTLISPDFACHYALQGSEEAAYYNGAYDWQEGE